MEVVIATGHLRTCQRLTEALSSRGHKVTTASTSADLLRRCLRGEVGLALVDMDLGPLSGVELLELIKEVDGDLLLVPLVGDSHRETEFAIRRLGVFYYMLKPVDPEELLALMDSAARRRAAS